MHIGIHTACGEARKASSARTRTERVFAAKKDGERKGGLRRFAFPPWTLGNALATRYPVDNISGFGARK